NVNYRYVADELRYLCADAELKAIVHDPSFADRVDAVVGDLPSLTARLVVGDSPRPQAGVGYESALAAAPPEPPAVQRSSDDRYIVYTGGTTGMPKGVVWRMEDAFHACF